MTGLWLAMIVAGLATYLIRLSFIWLFGRQAVPEWLRRVLRFVPPAVLTAIVFPEVLMPTGQLDLTLSNARLAAGLLAALVAWRTRNAMLTIVVGMLVLWILQW
ncbi:MAG: AzlD domain-containing protein [Chloroflexota bacterium]